MAEDEEEARKGERRGEQGRLGEGGGRVAACIGKLGRNNNGNIPHPAAQRGGKKRGEHVIFLKYFERNLLRSSSYVLLPQTCFNL